jgi:hypothetical protein
MSARWACFIFCAIGSWYISDVTIGYYIITDSTNNFVNITEVDTVANFLKGNFNVRLTLEERLSNLTPDTLRVKGSFSGKIKPL